MAFNPGGAESRKRTKKINRQKFSSREGMPDAASHPHWLQMRVKARLVKPDAASRIWTVSLSLKDLVVMETYITLKLERLVVLG